ncbi:MAG TPA: hypothetical protein PLA50_12560, partial [Bacteroidia bacterium]|nr:hypothetical protein [Bacteroidia bacterium]
TGEARERLRHIYDRDSRSRPDQIAQIAYDAGLIPDPSPSALFQSIRNRLEKTGGEAQITSSEQAEAAASAHEQGLTDRYDAFVSAIASPFRPDGADARTLRPGDTLEIGGETVTVVGRDEEGVELESGQWGRVYFASDEWIGYDKVLEDGGVPVEGRESLPEGQEVSREDAAESTRQIAAAMERGGIDTAPGGTRAVTSRRHTAMSKDRRGLEAARRLAALFGVRVVGVEGSPGNGFVLPGDKTRTVYIATDASRPEFLLVAHEMLHRMKNDAPALYRDVLDIISSEADFHAYLAELRPEHARHDADYIIEEFIADYLSDLMGTDRFWRSLADRDPSLFERFAQYVLDFLRSVRDQIAS